MHMLRSDADHFQAFGEMYFSSIYPGVVKAWHLRPDSTLNYAVPMGSINLVLFDGRPESPTRNEISEMLVGGEEYFLVTIPPSIWVGFACVGQQTALVANCATTPYAPELVQRLEPNTNTIPYAWK